MNIRQHLRLFLANTYINLRGKRLCRHLLDTQGFVLWCECGAILNETPAKPTKVDGAYAYKCHLCGAQTSFDFAHYPVPVKCCTERKWT